MKIGIHIIAIDVAADRYRVEQVEWGRDATVREPDIALDDACDLAVSVADDQGRNVYLGDKLYYRGAA